MPGREINLLPESASLEKEKEKVRQKSVWRSSLLAVFIIAPFILGSFLYSVYLGREAANLKKKTALEEKKIDQMKDREILLLWTKTKVLASQKILTSQSLYQAQLKALDFIFGLTGDDLKLQEYSSGGKNLKFSMLASSSDTIEHFIQTLMEENERQKFFSDITIKSVTLEEEGYNLVFALVLSSTPNLGEITTKQTE